jgi:hypothetical protein
MAHGDAFIRTYALLACGGDPAGDALAELARLQLAHVPTNADLLAAFGALNFEVGAASSRPRTYAFFPCSWFVAIRVLYHVV